MINLKNLPYLVILVLFGIILLLRCNNNNNQSPKLRDTLSTKITIIHDTIHDTIPGKPVLVKSEPTIKWKDSIVYKPDTSYNGLLYQYDLLGDKHFSKNIYKTKFSLGKYGSALSIDTVVANQITGSSLSYDIVIPETTKTIVIQEPVKPKNQIYIGGGLTGNQMSLVNGIQGGIIYKNKKDQIFQAQIRQPFSALTEYSISTYWKIKF